MNMRETRWVRDDGMRDERFRLRRTIFVFFHLISIGARSPATLENLVNMTCQPLSTTLVYYPLYITAVCPTLHFSPLVNYNSSILDYINRL